MTPANKTKCEQALSRVNASFENEQWMLNGETSTDLNVRAAVMSIQHGLPPTQVWALLEEYMSDIEEGASEVDLSNVMVGEFLAEYKKLVVKRWSDVDQDVFQGFKFVHQDDTTLVLVPTGRGKEYNIVGATPDDVYASLASLRMANAEVSRLHYIDNNIITPIVEACFSNDALHPNVLRDLSAAAADAMYGRTAIIEEKEVIGYKLDYRGGKPTVQTYIKVALEAFLAKPENMIREVVDYTNDPEVPTYRYMPLETEHGDYSAWIKWMRETLESPDAPRVFMTHIGACMDAGNTGKQNGYVEGRGDDAKSTVFRALVKYMGRAGTFIDGSLIKGDFGMSQFDGIRLGVLSDTKNPNVIRTAWVHQVSGGDYYMSNRKHRDAVKRRSITKLWFLENIAPSVNLHEDNQMSRIIYYKCRRKTDAEKVAAGIGYIDADGIFQKTGNAAFEHLIMAQAPAFIAACIATYFAEDTLCPTRSQVAIPQSMRDTLEIEAGDEDDDKIECALRAAFVVKSGNDVSREAVYTVVKDALGSEWRGNFTKQTIKALLSKHFSSDAQRGRHGGVRVTTFGNISFNPSYEAPSKSNYRNDTRISPPGFSAPSGPSMSFADVIARGNN